MTEFLFTNGDADYLRDVVAGRRFFPITNCVSQPATPGIDADAIKTMFSRIPVMAPPIRFVSNDILTITQEDWSQVRSPSRAARRRKQGHPQRIRSIVVPDPAIYHLEDGTVVGHPVTMSKAVSVINAKLRVDHDKMALNALYGRPL